MNYGPEESWFRPPKMLEMCRRGDRQRFLWIAEPIMGKISGVGYEIDESFAAAYPSSLDQIHKLAREELDRCIAAEETIPVGSLWEAAEYKIMLTRENL